MSVFKAYDIRGLYPQEVDAEFARTLGGHFSGHLQARRVAVGHDVRRSSPLLARAVAEGLRAAGAHVWDLGPVTTPAVYFAVGRHALDGGIMVTASHNPPAYNGFKLCGRDAVPIGLDSGLDELRRRIEGGVALPSADGGRIEEKRLLDDYRARLLERVGDVPALGIAVDTANGAVGPVLGPLLDRLSLRCERLFFEPDGTFPNHPPDPLRPENLRALRDAVRRSRCDVGAAFDGDGDRCFFVDAQGEVVPSDRITILLALDALRLRPGAAVVYDLRSSRAVPEAIAAAGGRPVRQRVGHAYMKAAMRREDAVVGGELSGHFYFSDHWRCDAAILAFLRVLSIVGREGRPLHELIRPYDRYSATGEINFRAADSGRAIEALARAHASARQDRLDGLTVEHDSWWFNVRPSNTEPLLRLNLEAANSTERDRRRAEIERVLAEAGGVPDDVRS